MYYEEIQKSLGIEIGERRWDVISWIVSHKYMLPNSFTRGGKANE